MKIRYFDNAATTAIKERVLMEMIPYLTNLYGNASSMYSIGRQSRRAIEEARIKVANLIKSNQKEIYFTSSGSESDNLAIKGFAYANQNKGKHIITSKIEHHAVLETCEILEKQGYEVTYLNVDKDGIVNLNELINEIRQDTILISIMFANNEIGTIEPIEEISKIAKANNVAFHVDAVQAVGNIPVDVKKLGIDMLSMSAHKIHGPKGVGALYVRSGVEFEKIINGGHQERNKRAGTENVAGIVGLGEACRIADKNLEYHMQYLSKLRNYYIKRILNEIPNTKINGSTEKRLPGNVNICFKNIDAQELLFKLDEVGICASAGSACNTGTQSPSHVLTAIGLTLDEAKGALRTTFGEDNIIEDIDYLIENLKKILKNT
jgi:cysteine desulfurase